MNSSHPSDNAIREGAAQLGAGPAEPRREPNDTEVQENKTDLKDLEL